MGNLAFLFPGQASQYVGMGKDLYENSQVARELFEMADREMGTGLSQLCFSGPEKALRETAITQPAVFVHSIAALRLLQERGLRPDFVAGHSLGEYSALVAAEALDFESGLRLVKRRGDLMQEAADKQPGAMAAIIGLDDDTVVDLCERCVGTVAAANFNAPGQLVISGENRAVEEVSVAAGESGAKKVVSLSVSAAFHSPLMESAAIELKELLAELPLSTPKVPVVTNVGASPVREVAELRDQLGAQMTSPVRWAESMACMNGLGVDHAVEVGPGSVLKGLHRRIDRKMQVANAATLEEIEQVVETAAAAG